MPKDDDLIHRPTELAALLPNCFLGFAAPPQVFGVYDQKTARSQQLGQVMATLKTRVGRPAEGPQQ